MPRNVRNFWVDGRIDGRSSGLSGGPQAREGGITFTILQRENGEVADGASVYGLARRDGTLVLGIDVAPEAHVEVITHRDRPGRKVVVHVGSETYSLVNTLDAGVDA